MSKKNRFWDTCAFMAAGTTFFRKMVFDRNYLFSGQTSPVIKFSIKSRKNNNVNVSSKKTSFGTKKVKKFFLNYQFSDKGRTIVLSVTRPPLSGTAQSLFYNMPVQNVTGQLLLLSLSEVGQHVNTFLRQISTDTVAFLAQDQI